MAITVFHYPACSTCKRALKWLDAHDITHQRVHIVEEPPSVAQLKRAHADSERPIRALFNTSGQSYRDGDFKTKLPALTDAQAIAALAADGKLIKRPLVLGDGFALIGFDEAEWSAKLG